MPSLSFLKPRESPPADQNGRASDPNLNHEHEPPEQAQRRKSKRDFFRTLISKPGVATATSPSKWHGISTKKPPPLELQPRSPDLPSSPMSDTNKPLPPPPTPGSPITQDLNPRSPIPQNLNPKTPPTPPLTAIKTAKLARIISPIAPPDLHKLFSGAPQFFALSEGHHTEAPQPSVAYPWNTEGDIRELSDHGQIQDEAWSCITAWPHIPAAVRKDPHAVQEYRKREKVQFRPRCRERPSMLSMLGTEKGTMGFVAALEMGVADALEESLEEDLEAIAHHRRKFLNGKEGLRPITDLALIERILGTSTTYHGGHDKHGRPTFELYTDLFTQIMYPPSRVTDSHDPYSLQVQIEALIDVLSAPVVWFDFSLVGWRIQLGRILWGPPDEQETEDDSVISSATLHGSDTQKYWLLLQILLACELLVRLDTITFRADEGVETMSSADIHQFDIRATPSVKWSLLLARGWLENIRIERPGLGTLTEMKASAGWLAAFAGTTTDPVRAETIEDLKFEGRHQLRQLGGLLHFARDLNWPNMERLTAKIATNEIKPTHSVQSTPAATPMSTNSQNSSSYFSGRRPVGRRGISFQKNVSTMLRPAGWLSSSYISGLVLPGEGLSHFLIATLLENDELAVAKLGDEANLFGGFVYAGQSFWSTGCVVGRVLAAKKGSYESMGWVSSSVVPRGAQEGWVDIDVEPTRSGLTKPGVKPRLWHKALVESSGSIIGGADTESVLPGDFVLPSDESFQKPFSVVFASLDLFSEFESETNSMSDAPTPSSEVNELSRIKTYSAMMTFKIETELEGKREVNLALGYDVNFVSSHPCVPSPYANIIGPPTRPSSRDPEHSSIRSASSSHGHLLHKAFTYTRTSILDLLFTSPTTPFSTLLSAPQSADSNYSSTHTTSSTIRKILVIDCTDTASPKTPSQVGSPALGVGPMTFPPLPPQKHHSGSDLEMLARALCAERGWNALVSRRGRGCVACAVRETGALGWKVVLRVA